MAKQEKINGDQPTSPLVELDTYSGRPCNQHFGLTKREYFAAMALQGFCANINPQYMVDNWIAKMAVKQADELIKELK